MSVKTVSALGKHPKPGNVASPMSEQEGASSRRARVQSGMHATTRTRVVRKPIAAH